MLGMALILVSRSFEGFLILDRVKQVKEVQTERSWVGLAVCRGLESVYRNDLNDRRLMAEVIGAPAAQVKSIFVYPIKSCRGISVSQAPITSTGFRWDRQWLVVNSKGRAYTQRVEPKLALVEVALPTEAFSEGWEPNNDSYLVIKASDMAPLKIPLANPSEVTDGVSVWEWSGSALDEGAEAAMWFSTHLGKPSRLVRFSEVKEMRVVDPNYARGYNVMFSDGYPYLVLSQVSDIYELCNLLKL
ncbi:hypothetical protein CQW23_04697 [Capsicum baccatum]|uniref:Molybdenum cofactor sulfurase middle domain-containing protein n=1 Tax=Capsicum baccatum TaxID=33114 RepID=A0A2G2XFU7_CAPBA|nr:hypothetical protein CQW23_04697 [Capsicum baccatum]